VDASVKVINRMAKTMETTVMAAVAMLVRNGPRHFNDESKMAREFAL
jgi:hypothetical protein